MAQVLIRNLEERVVESHRERARAKGRSLEAELREVVHKAAEWSPEEKLAFALEMQARWAAAIVPGVAQTPTTQMIREDRDSDDR